jgi:hypothetical protein
MTYGLGNRFGGNNVNRLRWACCKCVASTGELHKLEPGFAGSVILMSFSSWSANGGEGGGHSATLILSACFPGKISKSGGLEGYIADYKVDYISKSQSGPRSNADYVVRTVCLRKTCI